jgi:Fur family ferric uptake transcriptional regulator
VRPGTNRVIFAPEKPLALQIRYFYNENNTTELMDQEILQILSASNLRKTNIRKEVLHLFLQEKGRAISSKEIEDALDDPDRITLYRTLRTFEQSGVIHQAVDGSGTTKYALCAAGCTEHQHNDEHAHFHCTNCGKTICLEARIDSQIRIPDGFKLEHAHLMLEGECADCA